MTADNGENFQQRPDWSHPLGIPDRLPAVMDAMADRATASAYEAVLTDDPLTASRIVLDAAMRTGIFGYTDRAEELTKVFETIAPPESAETAELYADYRWLRLLQLLASQDPDPASIQAVIDAQRTSPYQTLEAQQTINYQLAQSGDEAPFRLWLETAMILAEDAGITYGVISNEDASKLGHMLLGFVETAYNDRDFGEPMSSANPESIALAREQVLNCLRVVEQAFDASSRQACFAVQLARVIDLDNFGEDPPIMTASADLHFKMIAEGAQSTSERNYVERLTVQRFHRHLLRELAARTWSDLTRAQQASDILELMQFTGQLSEQDDAVIERWRTPPSPKLSRSARRRANRRAAQEQPSPSNGDETDIA